MDLGQCKQKAVAMLRDYHNNEVCIQMLQGDLLALQQLHNYNRNMAVSYDQPGSSRTNKVASPVETELVILEQQRERLQAELLRRQAWKQKIDLALANMSVEKRMLLQLRYIEGMSWKQVVQRIEYSEDYIRKELNRVAVETLACYLFPELSRINLFARIF